MNTYFKVASDSQDNRNLFIKAMAIVDELLSDEQNPKCTPPVQFTIRTVIFNEPAVVVYWADDTKTVVKCGENDTFDPEKGLAMAISKKVFGNKASYYETFKRWLPCNNKTEAVTSDIKKNNAMKENVKKVYSEKKTCSNCLYKNVSWYELPCSFCIGSYWPVNPKWEPITDTMKEK